MSNEPPKEKSTEEQVVKIDTIVGDEALGYTGAARGEHSGEEAEAPETNTVVGHDIADNDPDQLR